MNLKALVVVLIRLFALNLVVQTVTGFLPRAIQTAPRYVQPSPIMWAWLVTGVLILLAVGIWKSATPIALWVTRGQPQEIFVGGLSLADGYSVGFLSVAMLYLLSGTGSAVSWIIYWLQLAGTTSAPLAEQVNFYQALQTFLPVVLAIVLLLRGRAWAVRLAKRHLQEEAQLTADADQTQT